MRNSALKTFWAGILAVSFFSGCKELSNVLSVTEDSAVFTPTTEPIARVRDRYLYREEIADLVARATPEDSANIVERFVDSWIKKQLILQEAEENLSINQVELERKVQDYKYQLMVYEYEKSLAQEKLSREVSNEEITQYYDKFPNSFELKQNIVKGIYLKVPKDVPRANSVRKWLSSNRPKDQEKLRSFAYSYASVALLNDTVWIDFSELISNTPFIEQIPNKVQALKSKRLLEASDSLHNYYVKVLDYKISDQLSPLEFVRDQIKDILLNKRKIELIRQHENDIYERAKRNNEYEILQ